MSEMNPDIRVAAFGDSFVQGVGDPTRLGWVGRLAMPHAAELTVYNMGIRRDTSADVAARWQHEAAARLKDGDAYGVCFSFGVNDTVANTAGTRVPPERSATNLRTILQAAKEHGWGALVLGPPPIADDEPNERIGSLDHQLDAVARREGIEYVSVFEPLRAHPVWMAQVAQQDGAHPAAEGYAAYAELVQPTWAQWIGEVACQ